MRRGITDGGLLLLLLLLVLGDTSGMATIRVLPLLHLREGIADGRLLLLLLLGGAGGLLLPSRLGRARHPMGVLQGGVTNSGLQLLLGGTVGLQLPSKLGRTRHRMGGWLYSSPRRGPMQVRNVVLPPAVRVPPGEVGAIRGRPASRRRSRCCRSIVLRSPIASTLLLVLPTLVLPSKLSTVLRIRLGIAVHLLLRMVLRLVLRTVVLDMNTVLLSVQHVLLMISLGQLRIQRCRGRLLGSVDDGASTGVLLRYTWLLQRDVLLLLGGVLRLLGRVLLVGVLRLLAGRHHAAPRRLSHHRHLRCGLLCAVPWMLHGKLQCSCRWQRLLERCGAAAVTATTTTATAVIPVARYLGADLSARRRRRWIGDGCSS